MIGAIAGDIVGSIYEHSPIKTKDFPLIGKSCRFTDDSVLTIAISQGILLKKPYDKIVRTMGREYPDAGYGGSFIQWLLSDTKGPYNSWGNGSAMRVSPVGYAFETREKVLDEALKTAAITHNHPEGIKGAQAAAMAVFLARTSQSKNKIKKEIQTGFGYDLDRTLDEIRPAYHFDISCKGTVPQAVIAFLESVSFEDAIRNAISLGGDSDTLACICGGIAEAFYKEIPLDLLTLVREKLTTDLWSKTMDFYKNYGMKQILQTLGDAGLL